jgi:hypothetical protein
MPLPKDEPHWLQRIPNISSTLLDWHTGTLGTALDHGDAHSSQELCPLAFVSVRLVFFFFNIRQLPLC